MTPVAVRPDARYRIVDEARIIDIIVLSGLVREVRRGERAAAVRNAAAALDRWVGAGLPFAPSTDGTRRFDPAEVVNFMKFIGVRDGDPFWEQHFVATARGMILDFHGLENASSAPPSPTVLHAERFSVTLEREFDLDDAKRGERRLLRLPLPLEDHALRDLRVEAIAPPGVDVEFTIGAGRLDARLTSAPPGPISLSAELTFTAYPTVPGPRPAALAASEVDLYTRASEDLIKISPRIRALAEQLAGSVQAPALVVTRFWDFMLDQLAIGVLHYDEMDPAQPTDWALETGWFDCQMGAALLIALCRAHGIPARMISGYLLYAGSPAPHYWAEVWLDARGWMPLDTSCADLSVRGRDASWRNYFYGCLDYRMKTQCLPRTFNYNPGMPFPHAWHMLSSAGDHGIDVGFFANDSGALVYRDRLSVRRGQQQ